jgi:hypothetical protein
VRSQKVWKVFWMRADLRWHGYEPAPEVSSIEKFLEIVDQDKSLKYVKKDKCKLGYIHHTGSLQIYLQGFPSKREFYLLGVGPQHAQKIYQTILSKVESTVA